MIYQKDTNLQVHRSMNRLEDGGVVFAGVLVAALDGHRLPVGPVDVVLEDCEREDVLKVRRRIRSAWQDDPEVGSVEVNGANEVLPGVAEEQLPSGVVDGQRVWPAQVRLQDDAGVGSCQMKK